MTQDERTARMEESLRGLKRSVDDLRDEVRKLLTELKAVTTRVERLEFSAERNGWWMTQFVRVGLPLLLILLGLGAGAWIQQIVIAS